MDLDSLDYRFFVYVADRNHVTIGIVFRTQVLYHPTLIPYLDSAISVTIEVCDFTTGHWCRKFRHFLCTS